MIDITEKLTHKISKEMAEWLQTEYSDARQACDNISSLDKDEAIKVFSRYLSVLSMIEAFDKVTYEEELWAKGLRKLIKEKGRTNLTETEYNLAVKHGFIRH